MWKNEKGNAVKAKKYWTPVGELMYLTAIIKMLTVTGDTFFFGWENTGDDT